MLIVAPLTGCGAHAVDAPSLDEIAAATRSDSYRFETSMKAEGIDDAFDGTATGAADPVERRSVIRYRFDGTDDEVLVTEVRRIEAETYTKISGKGAPFEDGWSRVSTAETDELGPFGAFSEPHRAADALARHGQNVEMEPGERIDGVDTTLYRATVPTVEILGGGATKARRDELEKEMRETDSELANVEAWAGADGLLRKLEVAIPITEKGETGHFRISMRFSDFGKPVEVEAPSASELSDGIIDYLGGAKGSCKGKAAAPHSAQSVVEALRNNGYTATGSCEDDKTMIFAIPHEEDGDEDNDAVLCIVAHGPKPPDDVDDYVVEGNVACFGEPSQRAALRTVLDSL